VRNGHSEETLIKELMHNAQASGNRVLEQRMADLTVWFYHNRNRIPRDNLASRQAFLEKAFWTLLEVNALLLERNHELEALRKGRSRLWLPNGIKVSGDQHYG
jgi:hypothetical protein